MSERPLVVVTGAGGAIGTATVQALLGAGCAVLGLDRAAGDVLGPDHRAVHVDLQHPSAEGVLGDALAGRSVHHLIQIAGGALPGEPETQHDPIAVDPDLFRASLEANLTTPFLVLRWVLPALRRATPPDRSITLTSSFNALGAQGMPGYSAAKAGLIGLVHALVDPLGGEGIRVNVVAPGTIRTPRTEALWGPVTGHFERLERGTALGRLGAPEDVARTFVALALQLTHVTGQVVVVDGGQGVIHR